MLGDTEFRTVSGKIAPCLNVKIHSRLEWPEEATEYEREVIWLDIQARFWNETTGVATAIARQHFGPDVSVQPKGHSSGWLAVIGLAELPSEPAWTAFAEDIRSWIGVETCPENLQSLWEESYAYYRSAQFAEAVAESTVRKAVHQWTEPGLPEPTEQQQQMLTDVILIFLKTWSTR